jgi:hypothetical protein
MVQFPGFVLHAAAAFPFWNESSLVFLLSATAVTLFYSPLPSHTFLQDIRRLEGSDEND